MKSEKNKFYIETLGCQMNKSDSESVAGLLLGAGYEPADSPREADLILINTCSVRKKAEDKALSRAGSYKALKKTRPNLLVGLMGCMAQRIYEHKSGADSVTVPELFTKYGIDILVGTNMFDRVPELVESARATGQPVAAADIRAMEYPASRFLYRPEGVQAWVTIMRGCDNFCSYCVVPYARGREYSLEPEGIIDEVRRHVENGIAEITLLGQNVNSYSGESHRRGDPCGRPVNGQGQALPLQNKKISFAGLLAQAASVRGLKRLRFVTNHPKDLSDDILDVMKSNEVICHSLHLPAQSGSTRMLQLMNRKYTREHYIDLVERARSVLPDLELASDFIVGFPTETDEDFEQTLSLMKQVGFLNSFVFRYSPRPGTKSAEMPDDVPLQVKAARNTAALDLQREVSEAKNNAMVGKTVEVLAEGISKRDRRRQTGRTRWNHIVVFEDDTDRTGELVRVKIQSATHLTLYGSVE